MLWLTHDDAQATGAEPLDEVEHLGGLLHAQGGGGLVEQDDLRVTEQRPRDRDRLPLAAGQRRDRHPRAGQLGRQLREQFPAADLHGHLVHSPRCDLAAEEKIRHDAQVLAQREILEHGLDAQGAGVLRAVQPTLAALEAEGAVRWRVHPGQDLDEGRLARPVVTNQGEHLARVELKIHLVERGDGTKMLADAAKRQDGFPGVCHRLLPLLRGP